MEWRQTQRKRVRHAPVEIETNEFARRRFSLLRHATKRGAIWFPVLAAALFGSSSVHAAGLGKARLSFFPDASHSSLHAAPDHDLRKVWARGIPERLFDNKSTYFGSGNAIEAFASDAMLLNPPPGFTDANATFRNVGFNPGNLSTVIDKSGVALVRLSTYIGNASLDNTRADGSHSPRVGSVSVHDIDLRGTIIRIERIR